MVEKVLVLHWFRQDLRLADNPALYEATKLGEVVPIYILDDVHSKKHQMGAASRLWLYHSLTALNESLEGRLQVFNGDPGHIIPELVGELNIGSVVWNRCYEPWRIKRDQQIKHKLKSLDVEVESFNGSLLWEPREVLKSDGTPYKVFTPFFRKGCLNALAPRKPLSKPRNLILADIKQFGTPINTLNLLPKINWDESLAESWSIGEQAAKKQLDKFLKKSLQIYKKGRDFPALNAVSRLSPHIHFGEISPNQIWYAAKKCTPSENLDHFLSELAWREFSYSLLYHFPTLPRANLQEKFDRFPWQNNKSLLKAWQKGLTGYPIVDAGMRELWQTGYMHNRVRMIVGSFLVKNLLLHWHHGERWFWDCLVDADLANNSASWQWVAGCGADAAPYFRIFNPITQGEKFDAHGEYTKRYCPELSKLPDKFLFKPWEAPEAILKQAGIQLGKDYPYPIIDLKESRQKALDAFAKLKTS